MNQKAADELMTFIRSTLHEALFGTCPGAFRTREGHPKWHRVETAIKQEIDRMVKPSKWAAVKKWWWTMGLSWGK